MNDTFLVGDIRQHVHGDRYIRIGHPHPSGKQHPTGGPAIWVHQCNADGELIGTTGRYLLAATITNRYRAWKRPTAQVYR